MSDDADASRCLSARSTTLFTSVPNIVSPCTTTASQRAATIRAKTASRSSSARASNTAKPTLSDAAVACIVGSCIGGLAGLTRNATCVTRGAASFRIWMSLIESSGPTFTHPVTLLLGRARLVDRLRPITSPPLPTTIGIVFVARDAASAACAQELDPQRLAQSVGRSEPRKPTR